MNRPLYYCKSWFRARKKPTEIWSEEQARTAHERKEQYTALVDSAERPYCFLDISDGVVGVGFLDEFLRESLTYAFQKVNTGQLFLTMATHREYKGESDEVVGGVSYFFEEDGTLRIKREFFNPHRVETATSSCAVANNYTEQPEFGDYDELIRVERG